MTAVADRLGKSSSFRAPLVTVATAGADFTLGKTHILLEILDISHTMIVQ